MRSTVKYPGNVFPEKITRPWKQTFVGRTSSDLLRHAPPWSWPCGHIWSFRTTNLRPVKSGAAYEQSRKDQCYSF